jgi:predicted RNA-binding protein (virulence factor B family)
MMTFASRRGMVGAAMNDGLPLGLRVNFEVERVTAQGAYLRLLNHEGGGSVLLPRHEVPASFDVGSTGRAFIYLDSEDRPVATLSEPAMSLGEIAYLKTTDLVPFGAFVDVGLRKELLVPLAEQVRPMEKGKSYFIGMIRDRSGRLAGTMRIAEMLERCGEFRRDEWVEGVVWRHEPGLGVFVILERRFLALVPAAEPVALENGETGRFRVARILADGKVEVSLRQVAHEQIGDDADCVLRVLGRRPNLRCGDHSPPQLIVDAFGLSKKAFKRAVGRLLREGMVVLDEQGCVILR